MKELMSVVVPCYNEYEALTYFIKEIDKVSKQMSCVDFEFIFVDDGSKDDTFSLIKEFSIQDSRIKYISLSRNFGKEAAIYAGLSHAKGDYVVIMDADMQDPPSLLSEMYQGIVEEGYDSVATRRVTRTGEPAIRSFFARTFYWLINRISDTEIVDGSRDFRLMNRKFVDSVLNLSEYNRFSKGLFCWVGFKTKWLEYENIERVAGETKWSFWKLFKYSIEGIIAFSTTPLIISSILGFCFCCLAFCGVLFIVIRKIFFGDAVGGWPSLACLITFFSGVQLFTIGVLGQYLSKTYLEVKRRPVYILDETNIDEKDFPATKNY